MAVESLIFILRYHLAVFGLVVCYISRDDFFVVLGIPGEGAVPVCYHLRANTRVLTPVFQPPLRTRFCGPQQCAVLQISSCFSHNPSASSCGAAGFLKVTND